MSEPRFSPPNNSVLARSNLIVFFIGLALFLVRIPFYMTGAVQEDAYIVFRTAVNFVDHGSYSFNVGLPDVGITCHAYAFLVIIARLIARDHFIPVVLCLNTILAIAGTYYLAAALEERFLPRMVIWIFASLLPAALEISILGMETSMLLFVVGFALYEATREKQSLARFSLPLFFLPWIRPDAIAYGLLFIAASIVIRKRLAFLPFAALLAGCATLAVFNLITTGHLINQTVIAKQLVYHVDKSPVAIADRLVSYYFTKSIFLPMGKETFRYPAIFFGILTLAVFGFSIWRQKSNLRLFIAYSCVGAIALLIPLPYVFEGAFFPWYFVISSLAATFLLVTVSTDLVMEHLFAWRKVILALGLLSITGLLCLHYTKTVMAGARCRQTKEIGIYIHEISNPGDTLFLEPAGYIPYFAGLRTYEEVGICSGLVLKYRLQYGTAWWMHFLKEQRPTYLFQRSHIEKHVNQFGYTMTPDEAAWFDQNYEVVKQFRYAPQDYVHSAWILRATGNLHAQPDSPVYIFRLRNRRLASERLHL